MFGLQVRHHRNTPCRPEYLSAHLTDESAIMGLRAPHKGAPLNGEKNNYDLFSYLRPCDPVISYSNASIGIKLRTKKSRVSHKTLNAFYDHFKFFFENLRFLFYGKIKFLNCSPYFQTTLVFSMLKRNNFINKRLTTGTFLRSEFKKIEDDYKKIINIFSGFKSVL